MDGLNKETLNENVHTKNIKESADNLLNESKKLVDDICDDGLKKIDYAQKKAEDYVDELLEKVKKNPLKAVLISGGVGFLLSILLKK